MLHGRRPWQEELEIIDRVLKTTSDIHDPQEMVRVYWDGLGDLLPVEHYLALSRRGVDPPEFLVTRSSRFTEHFNPWTQRERLPRLAGGLLGEIAYADRPVVIDDLPARLQPDDPGHYYLDGFQSLIALPNYEAGRGINIGISLFLPGVTFDHSFLPMMHWQAGLFGRGTQNLVLRNQLAAALRDLDRELQVVAEIQRSLLPPALPEIPGFEVAAFYQTSARAGGDYYDFLPLGRDEWGIIIADVSGHGTPAAVLMAITHAIAHTRPGSPQPPRDVLAHLNRHLAHRYTRSRAFVTAFYATLRPARRELTYAAAGHNPPRLLRGGRVRPLGEEAGLPLGIVADEHYGDRTIPLAPGDFVLFYTDGITEAAAAGSRSAAGAAASPDVQPPGADPGELFGVERLDAALLDCASGHPERCLTRILDELHDFTGGAPPADDQTLVGLRCVP